MAWEDGLQTMEFEGTQTPWEKNVKFKKKLVLIG